MGVLRDDQQRKVARLGCRFRISRVSPGGFTTSRSGSRPTTTSRRRAKFIIEHGHDVDQGPGQHGIGEQNYLYFRDPAGLRYELNSGGYRNYVPDWEPVIWRPEQGSNNAYRTEVDMPAVSMVNIPPGVVGNTASGATSAHSAAAALARS